MLDLDRATRFSVSSARRRGRASAATAHTPAREFRESRTTTACRCERSARADTPSPAGRHKAREADHRSRRRARRRARRASAAAPARVLSGLF